MLCKKMKNKTKEIEEEDGESLKEMFDPEVIEG